MRCLPVLLALTLLSGGLLAGGDAAPELTLELACNGGPDGSPPALEFSYSDPTCWNHVGHHIYFTGLLPLKLRHLTGRVFSVEQEFGAPLEDAGAFATPGGSYGANAGLASFVQVETSLDGVTWRSAGQGRYRWLEVGETLDCHFGVICKGGGDELTRQNVYFDIEGQGQEFRFLRLREPYSNVTQGLSGYLDYSNATLQADRGIPQDPGLLPAQRDLPCELILEAASPMHPCWFGGIDRYDAPSFFHTWYVADFALASASATFTVLPWRFDDFFQPGVSAGDLQTKVSLQASRDGVAWTTLGTASLPYGEGSLAVSGLGGMNATLLRLAPEKHARYDDFANNPANHHPRGFLLDSAVHIAT